LPYNLEIPGQVSEFQLQAIEAVASLVPPGGCVVEVGSLFGRSSWAWAKSIPQDAKLFCIDPWEGNQGVRSMELAYGIKYGINQFLEYTKDCSNIQTIQCYSPKGIGEWDIPVDIYYEDAVHVNPGLESNVQFWSAKLKPNGIICGDDYRPRFADVRAAADRAGSRPGYKLYKVDFFWCALPDASAGSKLDKVAKRLEELGKQAEMLASKELKGTRIQISPLVTMPRNLQSNRPLNTTFRIVNDGLAPWPAKPAGSLALMKRLMQNGVVLAEELQQLPRQQLEYDLPIDISVSLPFGPAVSGEAILEVGLAGRMPAGFKPSKHAVMLDDVPAYVEGEVIRFTSQTDLPVSFVKGWSRPERQHVWTDGIASLLSVNWDSKSKKGRWWLNLEIRPLVTDVVPNQQIAIAINGENCFAGTLSTAAHLSIPFESNGNSDIEIQMEHSQAICPANSLPGSRDHRKLAFALSSLSITKDPLAN